MILETFEKQPAEIKDYDVDYSPWLLPMGDTLADVHAFVTSITDPDDTDLECFLVLHTTMASKFWMRGGTDGQRYKLTIQAETAGGRLDESELIFVVRDY